MPRSVDLSTLSLPYPARQLSPGPGLSEPRLWLRRLRVWHDFAVDPVREIEFRRGLNIITSPAGASSANDSIGHAAGKTLLCRQIRYCLGEDSFADPDDSSAIRERFPHGGVGAEVRLRGESWVVRRAFSVRSDHRAKRGESFDELRNDSQRETFDLIREEFRSLAFNDVQQHVLQAFADVEDPWQYVLAWLTRDQECRLDGLTHWRHRDSSSHSPVRRVGVGADTRLDVLRVPLGLYSEEANAARNRVSNAAAAVSKAEDEVRRCEERFRVLRADLAEGLALEEAQVWPPTPLMFQDEASARAAHFQQFQNLVDERLRAVAVVEMSPEQRNAEAALETARGDLAEASERVVSAEQDLKIASEALALVSKEGTEASAALRRAKHPTCPFDDALIDVEGARFICPLPRLPDPAVAQELADGTATRHRKLADALASQREDLAKLKRFEASSKAKRDRLERSIAAHEQARAVRAAGMPAAWATKATLSRFIEAVKDLEEARATEKRERAAHKSIVEQKNLHLESYSTAHLTTWFDELVKRVVAAEARGDARLDANGLHATIHWRGRRRSVALNSLRIVLFEPRRDALCRRGQVLCPRLPPSRQSAPRATSTRGRTPVSSRQCSLSARTKMQHHFSTS